MPFTYQFSNHITIHWLVKNLPEFLFPDLSHQQSRIERPFIGFIATKNRQPVGLILANAETTQSIYRIHSFLVHPMFQNQGIGSVLLKKLENKIANRGGKMIEGLFKSHWKSIPYTRKLLLKQNWENPEPQLITAKGNIKKAVSFLTNTSEISLPFTLSTFTQLKKSEVHFIQNKQKQIQWFDSALDPFYELPTINKDCSFLLKKEQEVVGWIVSHQINPSLNEITALFIDIQYRRFKIAYWVIQKVLQQQLALGIPEFMVTSKMNRNAVAKLILREAERMDFFYTTSFYARKIL